MRRLLVVDDAPGHRLMVRAVTEDAGWEVVEAGSGEEALTILTDGKEQVVDVALVDMKMPGMDGKATLSRLHEIQPGLPVVLLTAYGTVGAAVEAMKSGAFDYLTKPVDNDELLLTLQRAYEYSLLQSENNRLRHVLAEDASLSLIVGSSMPVKRMRDIIQQAGPSEATVLISGESGTGKELVATALHGTSARSKQPLIKVNCAALPGALLESELFGYERGAFTGAVKDKPGRFQLADGGTLFLDEVAELPLDLQAKLLRALQEKEVEPLGAIKSKPVDVRVIAATNKSLQSAVRRGLFREDLFYRLHVLEIEVPPLRQRLDDLPLLVAHLLDRLAVKNRKSIRGVTPAFLGALADYSWPGNVRELENILERSLILTRGDMLEKNVLPDYVLYPFDETFGNAPGNAIRSGTFCESFSSMCSQGAFEDKNSQWIDAKETSTSTLDLGGRGSEISPLDVAERHALVQALRENKGHRAKTAETLGISRRALQYKLKKYGLIRRNVL